MNKVIIFGGTTEGRRLAQTLAKKEVFCVYCVATDYGKDPIEESEYIEVRTGRLDSTAMVEMFECEQPDGIIDATHPFATAVKTEIEDALFRYITVPFYRLLRAEDNVDVSGCTFFDSALDVARALENTTGKVFLTTGSKELPVFCQSESLRERIIARVIPNIESLEICKEQGLKGSQIIAMQGPFSKAMNVAFLKESGASILVLKEGGQASGEAERIEAAGALGIKCFVIRRPQEKVEGLTFDQVRDKLFNLFRIDYSDDLEETDEVTSAMPEQGFDNKINVILAGFGMGPASQTREVLEAIEEADYIFGAPRMLVGFDSKAKKYPHYLAEDIVPILQQIAIDLKYGTKNVVILLSGDTGFYSGAAKLGKALDELNFCKTRILPGISSISAIAARAKENWQDGEILSTHGIKESTWKLQVLNGALHNKKTFVITSGAKDVRIIGEMLVSAEKEYGIRFKIFVGTNLYTDERVEWLTSDKCASFNRDGLVTILIKNDNVIPKILAPSLLDSQFIRDKVPMSKEEIRALSVCKLQPTKNAVIYDIGSGSGSVAVELALLDPSVKVFAVEIKPEACSLIKKNIEKFSASNIELVEGAAPDVIRDLPAPTHVFIGGSGGRLEDILSELISRNTHIRIVINAVTLETISEINNVLKKFEIDDADIVQVTVSKSKKAGEYSLMQGQNPVYIVSFGVN